MGCIEDEALWTVTQIFQPLAVSNGDVPCFPALPSNTAGLGGKRRGTKTLGLGATGDLVLTDVPSSSWCQAAPVPGKNWEPVTPALATLSLMVLSNRDRASWKCPWWLLLGGLSGIQFLSFSPSLCLGGGREAEQSTVRLWRFRDLARCQICLGTTKELLFELAISCGTAMFVWQISHYSLGTNPFNIWHATVHCERDAYILQQCSILRGPPRQLAVATVPAPKVQNVLISHTKRFKILV